MSRPIVFVAGIWALMIGLTLLLAALARDVRGQAADVLDPAIVSSAVVLGEGDTVQEGVACSAGAQADVERVVAQFVAAVQDGQGSSGEAPVSGESTITDTTLSSFLLRSAVARRATGQELLAIHATKQDGSWCISGAAYTRDVPES